MANRSARLRRKPGAACDRASGSATALLAAIQRPRQRRRDPAIAQVADSAVRIVAVVNVVEVFDSGAESRLLEAATDGNAVVGVERVKPASDRSWPLERRSETVLNRLDCEWGA